VSPVAVASAWTPRKIRRGRDHRSASLVVREPQTDILGERCDERAIGGSGINSAESPFWHRVVVDHVLTRRVDPAVSSWQSADDGRGDRCCVRRVWDHR